MFELHPETRLGKDVVIGSRVLELIRKKTEDKLLGKRETRLKDTAKLFDLVNHILDIPPENSISYNEYENDSEVVILSDTDFEVELRRQFHDDDQICIIHRSQLEVNPHTFSRGIDTYVPDGTGLLLQSKQVQHFSKSLDNPELISDPVAGEHELHVDQIFALNNLLEIAWLKNH